MNEQADFRRWIVLSVGLIGLIAGSAAQYGLAYLIPALRSEGLALEEATLLVSAPIAGILLTLIGWGAAADRWGERKVLSLGLAVGGGLQLASAAVDDPIGRAALLFGVGASSASIHAASGRLILGWFAASERGLAMGIRQMSQPLGLGLAAVVLPPLAVRGIGPALSALGWALLASAALIWLVIRDPGRSPAEATGTSASLYREPYLWRIHAASALLVVPQFAVAVFAFDYLVNALGWSISDAGALILVAQLVGAASRLGVGWWSDRAGSRLRPMRLLAIIIGLVMALLSVLAFVGTAAAVVVLAVAAVATVVTNGLSFTAVAERAGSRWAGRALGVQNTFQNLVAVLVPTPLALVIGAAGGGAAGYALAFGFAVAFPFVAALLIPVQSEKLVATGVS